MKSGPYLIILASLFFSITGFYLVGCSNTVSGPGVHEQPRDLHPYYTAREAEYDGRPDEAMRLYRMQIDSNGRTPCDREAAYRLIRSLLDTGDSADAFRLSKAMVERFDRDDGILRLYAEACLACRRNRKALWAANEASQECGGPEDLYLLMEASRRIGLPVWRDRMLRLYLDFPASEIHLKALKSYAAAPKNTFSGVERDLIRGKVLTASGRQTEALESLKGCFFGDIEVTDVLVREMGELFRDTDRGEEGNAFFSTFLEVYGDRYPGNVKTAVYEESAWYLMSEGRYGDVRGYLEPIHASGGSLGDTAGRYLLTAVFRSSGADEALDYIETLAPGWRNEWEYSDLLDEIITSFTGAGKWESVRRLGEILDRYGSRLDAARCAYITGRALEEGYLKPAEAGPEDFFRTASMKDPGGYYGFVSNLHLSSGERIDYGMLFGDKGTVGKGMNGEDEFIVEFFRRGLIDLGIEEGFQRISRLSSRGAGEISSIMADRGRYLEALRFILRWNAQAAESPDIETLTYLYPHRFLEEIMAATTASGLPAYVFLALVREESAFQPDIVSRSGAVGLSQLMPGTADYTAGLMDLESFSILDPGDNTMIGARYLAMMRESLPSFGHSLAAYNAGPGRVRGWMKSLGHLPPDLFAEALPIRETRRYVKRVLVSSVYYGYLYDARPPDETVGVYYY